MGQKWLINTFKTYSGLCYLVIHECVHTQQNSSEEIGTLLGKALQEGGADFITEIILGQKINRVYINYGNKNEVAVKTMFKKDMLKSDIEKWMYNGNNAVDMPADMGYFMGYTICRAYYNNAKDKYSNN